MFHPLAGSMYNACGVGFRAHTDGGESFKFFLKITVKFAIYRKYKGYFESF